MAWTLFEASDRVTSDQNWIGNNRKLVFFFFLLRAIGSCFPSTNFGSDRSLSKDLQTEQEQKYRWTMIGAWRKSGSSISALAVDKNILIPTSCRL
jgi:hypothetical protein